MMVDATANKENKLSITYDIPGVECRWYNQKQRGLQTKESKKVHREGGRSLDLEHILNLHGWTKYKEEKGWLSRRKNFFFFVKVTGWMKHTNIHNASFRTSTVYGCIISHPPCPHLICSVIGIVVSYVRVVPPPSEPEYLMVNLFYLCPLSFVGNGVVTVIDWLCNSQLVTRDVCFWAVLTSIQSVVKRYEARPRSRFC